MTGCLGELGAAQLPSLARAAVLGAPGAGARDAGAVVHPWMGEACARFVRNRKAY